MKPARFFTMLHMSFVNLKLTLKEQKTKDTYANNACSNLHIESVYKYVGIWFQEKLVQLQYQSSWKKNVKIQKLVWIIETKQMLHWIVEAE